MEVDRSINRIIVHCSDSDLDAHDDISVIDKWHKERGWSGVGYHYFIKKNGEKQIGRPENVPGAHAEGNNSHSIGICLAGKTKNKFTKAQFIELKKLIQDILQRYSLTWKDVIHHRDVNPKKTCPNFDLKDVISIKVEADIQKQ